MPLSRYGLLKGQAVVGQPATEGNPHYQVHIAAAGVDYRIAVDVRSAAQPSTLLYSADENFQHALTGRLDVVADGSAPLDSVPGGLALDYVRGQLFDVTQMRLLPPFGSGPQADLNDLVGSYIQRAVADPAARVYAFGDRWGPEQDKPDAYFGFLPGNGIHDIHMNQGNSSRWAQDDGVWQDGGLLLHLAAEARWIALFLAFQSQSFQTDDTTGHAL